MSSDTFVLERTLGEGAFGKVYLVKAQGDGQQYAMKVIDLRTSPSEEKELAVKEANLLKALKHEHVLRYTDSFEKDGALCIVTEYCSRGDLSEFLEKRKGKKLGEDRLTDWFRQIACALQYLHGKKIIHRDVKAPNVFLSETWEVKLGDMGLAKVLERPNAKAVTFCGSPYYMSPEIFSCKPYDSKSDIWALGVIVYEMATLERPFDAMLMHQLVFKIVHGGLPTMPAGYKPDLTDLLTKIMQKDPETRPSADDILQHQYFKDAKSALPPSPRHDAGGAPEVPGRHAYGIVKPVLGKKEVHGAGGPFDMIKLLDTLTQKRAANRKADRVQGAVGGEELLKGIGTIIAKKDDSPKGAKYNKFKKDVTLKSPTKSDTQVSTSDVNFSMRSSDDFEATLTNVQSQVAMDAFNVMQLIVRTMTGLFPKDEKEKTKALERSRDPQSVMLRQIEHLQYYCIKVLGNDVALFQRAYDLMGGERDEYKLEEQLIAVLGHEKFGLCGVQLMFLKNFEYNLSKLQAK